MEKYWIIVGMMGAGKSTLGRELSRLSGRPFEDTDTLMQERFGRTVTQIFQIYGEETFREHETSLLKGMEPQAAILSTGGGVVLREANWTEMKRLGTTIFLDVDLSILEQRLENSRRRRPLLAADDWKEKLKSIYNERRALYKKADIQLHAKDENVQDSAQFLFERLRRIS